MAASVMDFAAMIVSGIFLLTGAFFAVVGALGIVRFPDFFTRLHGGGVTDTLGAGLILLGLIIQAGFSLVALKVLMIFVFLMVTSPTACHALAQAALTEGVKPRMMAGGNAAAADEDSHQA